MTIEPTPQPRTFGELGFDAFYARNLPVVYGYALRLAAGSVDRAQDLTQEAWMRFVDQIRLGRADTMDVRWLIAVVRNGYVDQWRRSRRLESKLAMVWTATRDNDVDESVSREQVVERLAELDEDHRIVLALRYIDCLPVDEIATAIGRSVTATYSLLARARGELRHRVAPPIMGGTS